MNKKTLTALAATALISGAAAMTGGAATADAAEMEKCYGVVEAGHNDCGNIQGTHTCEGQASVDGAAGEWLLVPEGTCDRLVGGMSKEEAKEALNNQEG